MPGARGKSGGLRKGAGRPPTQATLRAHDTFVLISQVWPDATSADLGRGVVGAVRRVNGDHLIVVPQKDGSELRILIGQEK
jgi:hypothetical protein